MNKALRMLKSLLLLKSRRTWGPFVESAEATRFDHAFAVSWSQGGEDIALQSIFSGRTKGTYLDIGAHHPNRFSVTRHLYQRGWNGVNVDANQALIGEFQKVRTRDTNLCFAIGLKEIYEFTIFNEPAISTVNPNWKARFVSEQNEIDRIEIVSGKKLRTIYDEFFPSDPVDLLTVDAEGADCEVLQSMEFDNLETSRFPRYLLLETSPPVSKSLEFPAVRLAIEYGYEPVVVLAMSTILKRSEPD